jgi:hypothetical protein
MDAGLAPSCLPILDGKPQTFLLSNWCSKCVPTFVDNILLSGWAVAFIFEAFPVHTIYSNVADFITYNGVALALSGFVYAGTAGRVYLASWYWSSATQSRGLYVIPFLTV